MRTTTNINYILFLHYNRIIIYGTIFHIVLLLIPFVEIYQLNVFNIIFNISYYIIIIISINIIALHTIFKLLDFVSNIDKTINNYIKIKGLNCEVERILFEENYFKFGGVILLPLFIFIFRVYSTITLLHIYIILLFLLFFFVILTSQKVIDFIYNCLIFINKLKEVLFDYLNSACARGKGLNINSIKKSSIYNKVGKINKLNSVRYYSTGPFINNSVENNKSFGWQYLPMLIQDGFVKENLNYHVTEFWKLVMSKYNRDQVVGILVKFRFSDGSIKTLSPLQRVNKTNLKELLGTLQLFLNMRADDYFSESVEKIIFQYIILNNAKSSLVKPLKIENKHNNYKSGDYNLPLTTDISKWGNIIKHENNVTILENPLYPNVLIFIKVDSDKQSYEFLINGKVKFSLEDHYGANEETFTRIIRGMQTLFVQGGEVVFKTLITKVNFIKPSKPCKRIKTDFLTLDLETRNINGVLTPYCCSIYNGKIAWSFYLSDYKSIDSMIKSAITSIMKRKYNGGFVYIHNSSLFDSTFLVRILTEMGHINFLKKDNKYINIKLSWDKYKDKKGKENFNYSINFRDSLLLLPAPLRKLANAFNVESKGNFPFKFVNDPNIPLDYKGNTPDLSFYEGISKEEYSSLITKNWSLKDETIKYCQLDCKVLHQVITEFNNLIFTKWNVNVHRFPTLFSLALGIFRIHYLGDHKIPKLAGKICQR